MLWHISMSQNLDKLIMQLKSLHLRQSQILEELEHMIAEEGQVIRQIEAKQGQPTLVYGTPYTTSTRGVAASVIGRFIPGDHIYISNEVKQRKGYLPVLEVDQWATVICIDQNNPNKVFITTDNNIHTWRLANHLKRLQ